jgi:hypothetical protein
MADEDEVDLDRVTPLAEWFERVGLPARTGHRLIANGEGPTLTQLSERRPGVRERDHLAWLDARRRSHPPT